MPDARRGLLPFRLINVRATSIVRAYDAPDMNYICHEERQILMLLQASPDRFFSAGEICKRAASRKLYTENPRWAIPHLHSLLDKAMVERDSTGHYRFLKAD